MITLSVIIPVLNENKHLSTLVPLLVVRDGVDEIVIVQASKNLVPFQYNDPKVKIVNSTSTRRSIQLNEGAHASHGQIYCFLHADVMPHENAFSRIKHEVLHGFTFGYFSYHFNPDNFLLKLNARATKRKGVFSGGGDQMHFMTRELFHSLGGYNTSFEIMEDFELVRRIKKLGIPYTLIQLPATVSSRKYINNSYVRVNFTNLVAFILFLMNINPTLIKKWCQYMLK